MAFPAVSTLLRFEPSTLYRFVCGLVGVVAVIGFLPGVHTGTPLEALDHVAHWWAGSSSWTWPLRAHHWITERSTQLGPIAFVAMFVGVFAARGNDHSPDQWRGSSTALAGWALAVETGGSSLGALLIAAAVGIAITRPFADRTPLGALLADTLFALFIAALYGPVLPNVSPAANWSDLGRRIVPRIDGGGTIRRVDSGTGQKHWNEATTCRFQAANRHSHEAGDRRQTSVNQAEPGQGDCSRSS